MDLELNDDQVVLQRELRRFLEDRVTSEARRAMADHPGAVDRALWRELAGMGVFALTQPESAGGVGLGLAEATVVFEELGRAAVPGPVVGSFLAAALVEGAGSGEVVVGVVPDRRPGVIEHLDGLDVLLVLAPGGVERCPPPRGRSPHDRPLDPLTPVTPVAEVQPGEPVGNRELADGLRRDGALLASALQVGLGEAALQLGVAYAKERTQFGRPIGSFQAVKHLLADAHMAVEVARAAVHAAAVACDESDGAAADKAALERAVDSARIVASRAAQRSTTTSIQVHGGMGYTWELDAHLLLKRAMVLDTSPGSTDDAYERMAEAG